MKEEFRSDKNGMKERHLANVKEAAEYMAISPMRLSVETSGMEYYPDVRIGRRVIFNVKHLDKFIEVNKFTLDLVATETNTIKRELPAERGDIWVVFTGGAIPNLSGSGIIRTERSF